MLARRPWTRLPKAFEVRWHGYPIKEYYLEPSGVTYSLKFEAREAACFAGYTYQDFLELPGEEQNAIVAHYQMHNRIQAVQADDAQKKAERKARIGRATGGRR